MLQSGGDDVVAADGGQAGIDACVAVQAGGAGFDIVFTDLGVVTFLGVTFARTYRDEQARIQSMQAWYGAKNRIGG